MVSLWSRSSRSRRSRSPLASAHLREYQDSPGISKLQWLGGFFFKSHPKLNRVIKTHHLAFSKTHLVFFATKCCSNSCDTHPRLGDFGAKSLSLQVRQESTHLGQNHGLRLFWINDSRGGDLKAIRNGSKLWNWCVYIFLYVDVWSI